MNADTRKACGLLLALMFLPAALLSCKQTARKELTPVTMQLLWNHISTYGGYYAADQKGYYAEEGLKVTFLPGGANVDYLSPVLTGAAQFGDGSADELIQARSEGKPVRAIAVIPAAARWLSSRFPRPESPGRRISSARPSESPPPFPCPSGS